MKLFSATALCCAAFSVFEVAKANSPAGPSLLVDLTSRWSIPFPLRVIESFAGLNETWYQSILQQLTDDNDDDGVDLSEGVTDSALYYKLIRGLEISEQDQWLVNFYISSNFYSPRIQSHYEDYELGINSNEYAIRKCSQDSFGRKLDVQSGSSLAWVLSKDRVYCSLDDLFALQLTPNSDMSADLKPYDRIIGSSQQAPLVILFGGFESDDFGPMLKQLFDSAQLNKLRFVWRYTPRSEGTHALLHYGVKLEFQDPEKSSLSNSGEITNIDVLGLKLVSLILGLDIADEIKYQKLLSVVEDLPSQIVDVASFQGDLEEVKDRVSTNIKLGMGEETLGIYVNGAIVNRLELDSFKVLDKIREELVTINNLIELGFNPYQAKHLLKKFALHTAVNQVEYNRGKKSNRYRVYENTYDYKKSTKSGGVIYINDIETDENYQTFLVSREKAYINNRDFAPGQIPPLKENIHDLIFVINLSSKEQLEVLFTFSKLILDRNIPQQIGILPLTGTELDRKVAKYFYFLYEQSPKEALAFLYKVFTREEDMNLQGIFDSIPIDGFDHDEELYLLTLKKFSLSRPSVIFNGVIKDLRSQTWQLDMGRQLAQDVSTISSHLQTHGTFNGPLKLILFIDSASSRNLHISPEDSSELKYKRTTKSLLDCASSVEPIEGSSSSIRNVWVLGSSNSDLFVEQCQSVLHMITNGHLGVQLKIVDFDNRLEEVLRKLDIPSNYKFNIPDTNSSAILSALSKAYLPLNHTYVLFGSRYVRVEHVLSSAEVGTLIESEIDYTTGRIQKIFSDYPDILKSFEHFMKKSAIKQAADWLDLLHSVLLKSFFVDDETYLDDVSRYDLSTLDHGNSLHLNKNAPESLIDLQVIVDPLDASSQELLSIINSFTDFPFLKIEILLQPKLEYTSSSIKQYFRGNYPKSAPEFANGRFVNRAAVLFDGLLPNDVYRLDLVTPKRWVTNLKTCPFDFDQDKIQFEDKEDEGPNVSFELTGLLIEGYAKDVSTGLPTDGIRIQVSKGDISKQTTILKSLGYFQMSVDYGTYQIQTIPSPFLGSWTLLSASINRFEHTDKTGHFVHVYSLDGLVLKARLKKSIVKLKISQTSEHSDVNIFTIVSGHKYEELAAIMVVSVMKNTKHLVKFWFIDNFSSPQFRALIPRLADEYKFSYEFVNYQWPMWLRHQKSKYRTVWGYKILFLDLLFPEDLDRVIFVDADQINRSDMMELVEIDMADCPYGFVPMCESREEIKGFRFWKTGYWAEVLKNDYKYHISALFVVNLKKFRELAVGEKLRSHYQKLSSDPNSLSNLDQDLPNNLQGKVAIYSLPQNYLWCETWCSDSELEDAKNIDLCNNPLTKEDKLLTAKRLIPEWNTYENQVEKVWEKTKNEWNQKLEKSSASVDLSDSEIWEEAESDYEHDEL